MSAVLARRDSLAIASVVATMASPRDDVKERPIYICCASCTQSFTDTGSGSLRRASSARGLLEGMNHEDPYGREARGS